MPRAVRCGTRPARMKTEPYGDCRMRRTPQDEAKPNALLMVARALLLRCPNCGAGGLFASWFKLRSACAVCGLVLEREEGYFLGAMMFNLVAAETLFVAVL